VQQCQKEAKTNDVGVAVVGVQPADDGLVQFTIKPDQGVSETFVRKLDIESSGDFLVRTDKAVYVAGQSLLTTVIGQGQQPVFVDLIRDGQTIRTDTVDLQNGRGILAFDIPTDFAGTLQLCAYRFRGDGLAVRKLRTLVVKPAAELRINLAADKPEYRPANSEAAIYVDG